MASPNEMTRRGFARREWRELGRLVLESAAAGMFVSLLLALAVFIASAQAYAAGPGESGAGRGRLISRAVSANQDAAPLFFTEARISINGIIAAPDPVALREPVARLLRRYVCVQITRECRRRSIAYAYQRA